MSKCGEALSRNKVLKLLDLAGNRLGDEGLRAMNFTQPFENNQILEHIDLSSNRIGAKGCKILGRSLVDNNGITGLMLSSNRINDKGMKYLELMLEYKDNLAHFTVNSNIASVRATKHCEDLIRASKLRGMVHNKCHANRQQIVADQRSIVFKGVKTIGVHVASEMDDLVHEYLKKPSEVMAEQRLKKQVEKLEGDVVLAAQDYGEDDIPEELTEELEALQKKLAASQVNQSQVAAAKAAMGAHKAFIPASASKSKIHNTYKHMTKVSDKTDLWGHTGKDNYLTGQW
jgi:hypothetical protein